MVRVHRTQLTRIAYAYISNGLLVNIDHGADRTESRGVFVSGINYKARKEDIKALFDKAREIRKYELQIDTSTRHSKSKATIGHNLVADAQQAVKTFHEKQFMDLALKVRLDVENTAVSSPGAANQARAADISS
ncbi:hypothetical protein LTR17_018551 [Elasticomyces elasticus]|nr:hypothetical protein LTR17_018551 [Elasticomyces elasticus]